MRRKHFASFISWNEFYEKFMDGLDQGRWYKGFTKQELEMFGDRWRAFLKSISEGLFQEIEDVSTEYFEEVQKKYGGLFTEIDHPYSPNEIGELISTTLRSSFNAGESFFDKVWDLMYVLDEIQNPDSFGKEKSLLKAIYNILMKN